MIYYCHYEAPIGHMLLASTDRGICKIVTHIEDAEEFFSYIGKRDRYSESSEKNSKYVKQLDEYFKGNLKEFHMGFDIKGTDFQLGVWKELTKIPYGQVRTYGDIARDLGMRCPRAVGQANKKNPLPIVVPCHRVVSSRGIGGYSGQTEGEGIAIKKYLLLHEGVNLELFK